MGVGTNAAGQLGGALAAVGVASRMIGDEKAQALAGGTQAKQAIAEASEGLKADYAEQEKLNETLQSQKKDAETLGTMLKPDMSKEDMQAWQELKGGLDEDMEKADLALNTLEAKIMARQSLMNRAEAQLKRAQRWGGAF
jgi:uncharacterized protein (DUF342 family)